MIFLLVSLAFGCGQKNAFDCDGGVAKSKCSQRTKYENARMALDDGDLDRAITLLSELITDEPAEYERYPLLAAAYAGRGGIDILNIVTANFGGNSSMLQTLSSVIPTPASLGTAYDSSVDDVHSANETLLAIPAELRDATSSDKYAASAVLQLTLEKPMDAPAEFTLTPKTTQINTRLGCSGWSSKLTKLDWSYTFAQDSQRHTIRHFCRR